MSKISFKFPRDQWVKFGPRTYRYTAGTWLCALRYVVYLKTFAPEADIYRMQWITLGRDLMRERTRSRIQDGGLQKRSANTVAFLPFNADFATRNWCPLKFVFRINTCDIKFDRICPWLLLGSVWKLTQDARTNLTWCANVHCIKTTDARTHIKMR